MSRRDEQTISAGRRHIIERPRLTRILDEATAKVITLVAPAGYGKTTLARQWLAGRPHAWLQANEALSDVAALATAIARALADFGSSECDQLLARVRTMRDVRQELRSIVELQSQHLGHARAPAWFVLDDYEHIAHSPVAEDYVRLLVEELDIRFLIASRVNPLWATPRAVLYGHVKEVGRDELSMEPSETRAVLDDAPEKGLSELLELAEGWPALVGLASLTDLDKRGVADLPRPLFAYLADELFLRCSRPLRLGLPHVALAPRTTPEVAAFLLGPRRGPRLIAEANQIGFFTDAGRELRLHPLLQRFLLDKVEDGEAAKVRRKLVDFFLQRGEWDDAFEVLRQLREPPFLVRLCDAAYKPMLARGRATTLETWLQLAGQLGLASHVFLLIRAELALRNGNLTHAQHLADEVISAPDAESYRSRALIIAGRTAHLANRESDALRFFEHAARVARSDDELYEAQWGSLLSAEAFESDEDLLNVLEQFLRREPRCADDVVRAANARLMVALAVGKITDALEYALDALVSLDHAGDPLIRTSFLNNLSRSLSLQGRYPEASAFADRLLADAKEAGLEFVLPHAFVAKAVALIGQRDFEGAEDALDHAARLADEIDDKHNVVDARNVKAKLAVTTGDHARAMTLTEGLRDTPPVTPTMRAEALATHALVQACAKEIAAARTSLAQAEAYSRFPEIRSLGACVRTVIRLQQGEEPSDVLEELQLAFDLCALDPVIIVCRAFPSLARALSEREGLPQQVAGETAIARTSAPPDAASEILTPREKQVLTLVTAGYTNREIARELFIEEVTAKVHVRSILRKLGVRSRTEAAIAALRSSAT